MIKKIVETRSKFYIIKLWIGVGLFFLLIIMWIFGFIISAAVQSSAAVFGRRWDALRPFPRAARSA